MYAFIYSFIHSFIHSFVYSFVLNDVDYRLEVMKGKPCVLFAM
jgi:hypothetical protein